MQLNKFLLDTPPLWVGAEAVYPYSPELHKKFYFETRFGEQGNAARKVGNYLHVPRAVAPIPADDRRTWYEAKPFPHNIIPRSEEQAQSIALAKQLIHEGKSFLFEMPTGGGKTVCAINIIAEIGQPTLVIVPKEDLMKQWFQQILKFTDLLPKDIGFIQQDRCDIKGKKVVIGMLHSLAIDGRYSKEINDAFGMVIVDECHRLGADGFCKVMSLFNAKVRIGLSATPKRSDGKEDVFMAHIGPIMVKAKQIAMKPKVLVIKSKWQCPRVRQYVNGQPTIVRLPHSPGKVMHILTQMTKDTQRNLQLVNLIATAHQKGRKVVVFTELINHIDWLYGACMKAGIPMKDLAKYVGGMKEDEKEKAKVRPVILATYKMMAEGTDIPWLDCCILGTPRADIKQAIGRVLREHPEKKQPVVMDIQDDDSPVFVGYSKARQNYYKLIGSDVMQVSS